MGRNPVLLLLLSAFVASSFAIKAVPSTNLSYIVVTSDVLVPGSKLLIDVQLFELTSSEGKESEECVLDLKVWSEGLLWHVSNWKIEVDDTPRSFMKSLKLLVPEEAILKDKHVLKIESNSCFKFSRSVELKTERRELLVSITTDKLVYQPGDKVSIQIIVPYKKHVNLSIYCLEVPFVRWLNLTSEEGVLIEQYKLPLFLRSGNVTIVLENHKQQVNHTIVVRYSTGLYQKEQFLVDVRVPRYLTLPSSDELKGQNLEVSVVSSSLNGIPLHGSVELHLFLGKKSGSFPPVELESGHKIISLKPDEVKEILNLQKNDSLIGRKVYVEVIVEEHVFMLSEFSEEGERKVENREGVAHAYVTRTFFVTYLDQSHVLFFTEFTPLFFKPGLEYVGQVLLKEVEERLPIRSEEEEVTVNVKHYTSNSESPREEKLTLKIKSNSVGEFSFKVPKEDTKLELEASFDDKESRKHVKTELKEVLPFSSKDGHFVQILLKNKPPKVLVGKELKFTLESTFSYNSFTYKLFSQSFMVISGVISVPSAVTMGNFSILIPDEVSQFLTPTRLLIVIVDKNTNEMHADSLQFVVEKPQEHPLNLKVPTKVGEPGSNVEVTIKAEPFTKVYLVVLPELLAFEPKELEVRKRMANEKLLRYLRSISTSEFSRFVHVFCETCSTIPSVAPDTQRLMNESGTIVLTDGYMSLDSNIPWPLPVYKNGTLDDLKLSYLDLAEEFEVELWNVNVTVGHSGEEKVQLRLPNKTRLYTLAAFGVRPGRGLVVSEEPIHLVSAPRMLASLEYPRQVVRGEEFVLEVHLYNKNDVNVYVDVMLKRNVAITIGCLKEDKEKDDKYIDRLVLSPKKGEVVPFLMRTIQKHSVKQGTFELEVEVFGSDFDYESDFHYLLKASVEFLYEEHDVSLSESLLLDNFKGKQTLVIDMPKNMREPLKNSRRAVMKVFGHPLGPVIEHVCRDVSETNVLEERTKLWFVLALNVLEHISNNSLFEKSVEIESNEKLSVKGSFEIPVQKEECVKSIKNYVEYFLYKRRDDGSYSFYSSAPGYLWLTSLMLDALVQLRNVVSYDKLDVVKTLKWLAEQQQADGSFVEPEGAVLIREDIEGSHNVPLTSQVVVSLLEAKHYLDLHHVEVVNKAIKTSMEYLENVLLEGDLDKDSYSLSVGTYALKLADSEKFLEVLMKRDKLVITEGNEKYWRVGETENYGENALSLEATSYAILTSLSMKDLTDAKPYINHVSKHMRPNGAFVATQDTKVALKALSLFHRLHDLFQEHRKVNVEVNVTLSNEEKVSLRVLSPFFVGSFHFNETNINLANSLKVETSGEGVVLLQSCLEFNENISSFVPTKLDFEVVVHQDIFEIMDLDICVKNLENKIKRFLIGEIPLMTGYDLNVEKIERKRNMHVIIQNDKVYVVFNEVQPGSQICVWLPMQRKFKIEESKAKYVKLYSAEEPSKAMIKSYMEIITCYGHGVLHICPLCWCWR